MERFFKDAIRPHIEQYRKSRELLFRKSYPNGSGKILQGRECTCQSISKTSLTSVSEVVSREIYITYELRNRNQRFLCYSLSCGDVLIHKNSSAPTWGPAPRTLYHFVKHLSSCTYRYCAAYSTASLSTCLLAPDGTANTAHSTASLSTCLLAPIGTANTAHSTASLSTCLLAPYGTANTAHVMGKKP